MKPPPARRLGVFAGAEIKAKCKSSVELKISYEMDSPKLKFFFGFSVIVAVFAVLGYLRAIPGPPLGQDSIQAPKIVVEPKVFDFGEVDYGKIVEHTFRVSNTGGKALEIKRVSTSCACTKARVAKEKLEVGETTSLLVTYDAGAMGKRVIGKRVERIVYIKSNDPESPQVEVAIKAIVKPKSKN